MKVQVSSIEEKKESGMKGSMIRTHDSEGPVYHTTHQTTADLFGWGGNNVSTYSVNPNHKKELTSFETVLNPNP